MVAGIDQFDRMLHLVGDHDRGYRAEGFLLERRSPRRYIGKYGAS